MNLIISCQRLTELFRSRASTNQPWITCDLCSLWHKLSFQLNAALTHGSREYVRRRRIQSHRFLHTRYIIGTILQDLIVERHFADFTCFRGCINLLHELRIDRLIGHDMIDHALKCCACGIRTCKKDKQDLGFDVVVRQRFAIIVAGVNEATPPINRMSFTLR